MKLDETYTLANGVAIPKLGLGTWLIDDDAVTAVVRDAIRDGYRHIDTAQAYENERGVGEGLRASGVARDELFVTTKLDAGIKAFDEAEQAIDGSLKALGLDHIDLMIIHSPQPWQDFGGDDRHFEGNREAWRALEAALKAGKLRAIGVSNFQRADLDNLLDHGSVAPMVNQVLAHVGNTPFDLIDYAKGRNILTEAYSPVAHGQILDNEEVAAMAKRYGVSVPQLCIRYCLELGLVALPKSANPDHVRQNGQLDFAISDDDMATLKAAGRVDYGEASKFPVYAG